MQKKVSSISVSVVTQEVLLCQKKLNVYFVMFSQNYRTKLYGNTKKIYLRNQKMFTSENGCLNKVFLVYSLFSIKYLFPKYYFYTENIYLSLLFYSSSEN